MASKLLVTVVALCLMALVSKVWGAPLPRYGTFVYSSLCGDPVGDIDGSSLTVTRTPKGDRLTYDYSEGALFGSTIKDLRIRGDRLTATAIPDSGGGEVKLTAVLDNEEAVLTVEPDHPVAVKPPPEHLRRVWRIPKPIADCPR